MSWPTYTQQRLPEARPAKDPALLERLREAGEIIHKKLERLPRKKALGYAKGLIQIQALIEKFSK
jgi:hypothetical protein